MSGRTMAIGGGGRTRAQTKSQGDKIKHKPCNPQDQRQHGEKNKTHYEIEHMDTTPLLAEDITNPNNKTKEYSEYNDIRTQDRTFMDEVKLRRLSLKLTEWYLNDPSATQLSKFFAQHGITEKTYWNWRKKWPWFDEICEHGKECIAHRLFDGGITRAYEPSLITKALPMNSKDWKEESNRVARIRDEQAAIAASRPITIEMVSYAEPKKIEDKPNEE